MQDQSATTLEKYVCKLVEYILFYSQANSLSAVELCKQIKEQFSLEFDVLEIENAVARKSRGRIILCDRKYQLSVKAVEQFKRVDNDPNSLLRSYILKFLKETKKEYNVDELLENIQKYLYYSFNSSTENFLGLCKAKITINTEKLDIPDYMVQQINEFISWENDEKNKLIYDIVSFSYEYCMLTTKKNDLLTRNLFKGKRFFLDANIVFRMAGINQDERQFVIESFIKKCNEIGIELCYTSDTLSEVYRVIDGQIIYIKNISHGQAPIDAELLQSMDFTNEINDFYVLYYNWCKIPGNSYADYISFRKYLVRLVSDVFTNLNLKTIPDGAVGKSKETFENLCAGLDAFKKDKRPRKPNSKESLKTDINNVTYIISLRNQKEQQSLWQVNDYFVSADQLLTNWAKEQFSGVPIVVIPSIWLSIMLHFGGRSEDDYKAFCLFMSLRQHRFNNEEIIVNPVLLLDALSKRTSDRALKQQIVEEIINNRSEYTFECQEDYATVVENAFENILEKAKEDISSALTDEFKTYAEKSHQEINKLKDELKDRSTQDEYIMKHANKKAENAVEWWKKLTFLKVLIPALSGVLIIYLTYALIFQAQPVYGYLQNLLSAKIKSIGIDLRWDVFMWLAALFLEFVLNAVIINPLNYLSSDERKQILVKKYTKKLQKELS